MNGHREAGNAKGIKILVNCPDRGLVPTSDIKADVLPLAKSLHPKDIGGSPGA